MNAKKKLKKSNSHGMTPKKTSKSEFPLSTLPDDVLEIVFFHLAAKDRLQTCLVCKKWLELINCRSLLSDITLKIRFSTFENYSYPGMTRNFLNVDLLGRRAVDNWKNVFEYISPCVEYLRLCHSTSVLRYTQFSQNAPLQNLRQLDALCANTELVFPSCSNLSILSLFSDLTTDYVIAVLQKTMKRLKVFRLYKSIVDDPTECRKYYPLGVTYEENPSSKVLSFFSIKSFISERVSTLSEIEFTHNHKALASSTLAELLCVKGLNLTKLCLRNKEIDLADSTTFFNNLFRSHQNLKTLNLFGFNLSYVNDVFSTLLPNIEELGIACEITDETLRDIFNLKKLKKLSILKCTGFTPSGCREAISSLKPIQLKHLELHCFVLHKESATFFKEFTHLVKLDITECNVTDSHVHVISTYLVNLEYLGLTDIDDISDYGLNADFDTGNNQGNIYPTNITGYKALDNLKRLRILDLSWCLKLTRDGIIAAIRFTFLHTLVLDGFTFSEIAYSVLLSQNPKLTSIGTIVSNSDSSD